MARRLTMKEYEDRIKIGDEIKTNANGESAMPDEEVTGKVMEVDIKGKCFYIDGVVHHKKNGKKDIAPQWWISFTCRGDVWVEICKEQIESTYSSIIKDLRIGVENGF